MNPGAGVIVPVATLGPSYPGATLAALVGLLVFSYAFLKLGPAGRMGAQALIPEGRLRRYTEEDLRSCLKRLGGPDTYRRQLVWDFVYMLVYGVAFAFLLDGTWGRVLRDSHDLGLRWLVFLPAALMVLWDFRENTLLLAALPNTGEDLRRPDLVPQAARATRLKWLSFGFVLVALASGALALAFRGPVSL